jgi:hypothetical protein
MSFQLTYHMRVRLRERGLQLEDIKAVVRSPHGSQIQAEGPHRGKRMKFWKTVDGRTMIVAAVIKDDDCLLLTAFYGS